MFSLSEDSGYLWNSFVYLRKNGEPSQSLFEYLYEHDTVAADTAQKNRIDLPKSFKDKKLQKNEHDFRINENLLAVKFQDKKEILMLSTIHTADVIQTRKKDRSRENVRKLKAIHDYNQKMGGVDKNHGMVGNYSCIRKTYKWTTKVFFHFLEEAIFNSFLLHSKNNGKKKFLEFKVEVVCQMLSSTNITIAAPQLFDRLKGRNFSSKILPTEKKVKSQKRCVVCYSKEIQKESRYHCNNCEQKPGLCQAPCFMLYHTLVDYSQL